MEHFEKHMTMQARRIFQSNTAPVHPCRWSRLQGKRSSPYCTEKLPRASVTLLPSSGLGRVCGADRDLSNYCMSSLVSGTRCARTKPAPAYFWSESFALFAVANARVQDLEAVPNGYLHPPLSKIALFVFELVCPDKLSRCILLRV